MRTTQQQMPNGEFIVLNALLMALVAAAINLVLPAFHALTMAFHLPDPTRIGLAVTLLYLGLAIGQVAFGAVSDSMGRVGPLLAGLALFTVGAAGACFATSFEALLAAQVVQGIGLGAPRVLTLAIARDRYKGDTMAKHISFMMVLFTISPTLSPYLGQALLQASDWRALFVFLLVAGALLFVWVRYRLPESHPVACRTAFSGRQLQRSIGVVMRNPAAVGFATTLGISSSAFIIYLNTSQQVFAFQYALGDRYPAVFAMLSLSLAAASFLNGLLVLRLGARRLVLGALISMCSLSTGLALWVAGAGTDPELGSLLAYLAGMLFCFGLLVSNLNALAMQSLGATAGTGAAMVGAISTLVSLPLAIWVGGLYAGTVLPLILSFAVFPGLSLLLFQHSVRWADTTTGRG